MHFLRSSLSFAVAGLLAASLVACNPPSSDKDGSKSSSDTPSGSIAAGTNTAAPASIEATAAKLFPGQTILSSKESVIKGLQEVIVAGNVYYASPDGKYFMQGDILDVATMKSVTEESRNVLRESAIGDVDVKDAITFAPKGKAKYDVYVFTDVDCGYCRKLHEDIKLYNAEGIAVHYLPYPRSGLQGPTHETMVSVWCAKDKNKALTDAKNSRPVEKKTCENPVDKYYQLGQRLMIQGTPAIFDSKGKQYGGYVPAPELLKALSAPVASTTP